MGTARLGGEILFAPGSGSPQRSAQSTGPAPNMDFAGRGLFDMRGGYNQTIFGAVAAGVGGFYRVLHQAPSTAAVANIAVAANVASGTPMTLVGATGAGITVLATALTVLPSLTLLPSGTLAIDAGALPAPGAPPVFGVVNFGLANPAGKYQMNWYDPTKAVARAVSITGAANATGGHFVVAGYDLYGYPQTENINAGAGAATTNGAKGWKFISSVTPKFTDAHNYSIGTADIFEFPLRCDGFPDALVWWNDALITANTGFVAADTTNPATATTGSVRGTYAVQSAADGTKALTFAIVPILARCTTAIGMWGVTPA